MYFHAKSNLRTALWRFWGGFWALWLDSEAVSGSLAVSGLSGGSGGFWVGFWAPGGFGAELCARGGFWAGFSKVLSDFMRFAPISVDFACISMRNRIYGIYIGFVKADFLLDFLRCAAISVDFACSSMRN